MISYEINAVCDACENACVTTIPIESPNIEAIISEAQEEGWKVELVGASLKFACVQCQEKGKAK